MKVVIIGSGNVAGVLGQKIAEAGNEIVQVIGRNEDQIKKLAAKFRSTYATSTNKASRLADIYIVSVSDSAIVSVAEQLKLNDKVVVHTAAAVSKDVLKVASTNYGVLYPLQSLRKGVTTIPSIPILVDSNNDKTRQKLIDFATPWADSVTVVDDEQRLKLHVAAVFVNNFANHLFAIAERFCVNERLNFNLLRPIIEETIKRIGVNSPSNVQTGPAIRNDSETTAKHNEALAHYPDLQKLYHFLTDSIVSFHKTVD
jgi:predicted short-subunit dehydrogenase-like oxidoreductase (DUF2520 family)